MVKQIMQKKKWDNILQNKGPSTKKKAKGKIKRKYIKSIEKFWRVEVLTCSLVEENDFNW